MTERVLLGSLNTQLVTAPVTVRDASAEWGPHFGIPTFSPAYTVTVLWSYNLPLDGMVSLLVFP